MVSLTAILQEQVQVPSFFSRKRLKVLDFECQDQDSQLCVGNYADTASSMQPTEEGRSSHRYYINCVMTPFLYQYFCF